MKKKTRYLTKSRFKLALECPTKLFYTGKDEYPSTKTDDTFLVALAEGGFQVGELAKCYFPGGHDIVERSNELSLSKTNELLKQENVIIYEAAIRYENLFIRVDVLKKQGNNIELIEVKAKSSDGSNYDDFLGKKGQITSSWKPYLHDVAFQKYVVNKAFPNWQVKGFLMLANKSAVATIDGLNQKFQLTKTDDDKTYVKITGDVSPNALGKQLLSQINVDELILRIWSTAYFGQNEEYSFEDYIHFLANHYDKGKKIITPISNVCKGCEFNASEEKEKPGQKSGFKECWKQQLNWSDNQFKKPFVFDVWNLRTPKLLEQGIYHIEDVEKEHIGDISPEIDGSLSSKERQWLQIEKIKNKDKKFYVDKYGLRDVMNSYTYPLHFIDFETSMVAIPFYKGRRPYEQTAFQFSHHIAYENGAIEHKGQYLCTEKGKFPNFDFVRALKKELENDEGTIFRYAPHENTVLNQIMVQLQDTDVSDKEELITFIKSITHGANHNSERDMVDMLMLVKKYYYHPSMGGSNSIKAVLPAVLNASVFIKGKYSKPVYGKTSEVKSLNFDDGWIWIEYDEKGKVTSPYKLLPNLHEGIDNDIVDKFIYGDKLADGGAAMTGYAKMQFMNISEEEHQAISVGLLKYCELDTLAMVMIWEHFKELTGN
ncbi:hypothetical protein PI23P_04592 [Polaribacter irgensii 23-P]|uniref:DUF2779 domain-containing protein n=1 Tax=Polaribacter irgensii 23-P TaxID=313594 RepID=A4BXQ5_9FLAO|nr:DUF2779 domain-containing protein [Polaribacter irgensii]EAR13746.1 hypothetical protein PI23P_04592 [Polaribacter irgensii 23-P]